MLLHSILSKEYDQNNPNLYSTSQEEVLYQGNHIFPTSRKFIGPDGSERETRFKYIPDICIGPEPAPASLSESAEALWGMKG